MNQLDITIYQQPDAVTCVHTILRIAADYFGYFFSHKEILEKLGCGQDGYYLSDAAKVLKKHCNLKYKTLYSIKQIEKYIDNNQPVMSTDNYTYIFNHAILLVGYDKDNFSVLDPNTGQIIFKNKKFIFKHSDQNIVIYR